MKALKKYAPLAAIVAAAIAVICIFLPAISYEVLGEKETWSGLKIAFGDKTWKFSILNLLPYLLVIAAGVLTYLGKKGNKDLFELIAIVCFVVAAILFFLSLAVAVPDAKMTKEEIKAVKKLFDLGIGSIIAAIVSLLGAGAVAIDRFVK